MKTLKKKINNNKKINIVLLGIFISFISYSYAIAGSTFSISNSEIIDEQTQELQTEIAELELAYFEAVKDISLDTAIAYDLTEAQSIYYVSVDSVTAVAYNSL